MASLTGVRGIREQVKVRYRWNGAARTYTFDIIVEWRGGYRTAFAVRATHEDLHKDDTLEVLKTICAQHGADVADDYRVLTYEMLDPVAVLNGRRMLRCGRDQDHVAMEAVRGALAQLGPVVTLAELADATGLGQRGIRAAIALLPSGALMNPPGKHLRPDLSLENRAQAVAEGSR